MKRNVKATPRSRKGMLNFFKDRGIVYLERSRIAWRPLLTKALHQSPYYLENEAYFRELCDRYGEQIRRADKAPLYIEEVGDDVGYGVFAAADIEAGAFIGEYAGVVQPAEDEAGRPLDAGGYESDYSWYYLDEVPGAPDLEINGRLEGNELRFVNHSDTPNLEVEHTLFEGQWVLFFTAARDIRKGEQLLISYGEAYWEDGWRDCEAL